MKEWSNKPTSLVQANSSGVVTSSAAVGKSSVSLKVAADTSAVKLSTTGTILSRIALVNPVSGGVFAAAVGAGIYGAGNIVSYAKKKKTGKQAIRDTAKDSAGLGVSAGAGIITAKAVSGTWFALGSFAVVPIAAGITVMYVTKRAWNKLLSRKQKKQ